MIRSKLPVRRQGIGRVTLGRPRRVRVAMVRPDAAISVRRDAVPVKGATVVRGVVNEALAARHPAATCCGN